MTNTLFKGVGTAIVTPFCDGEVDYESLDKLIHNQITAKVDAIILLGTTGESSVVSIKERAEIIAFVKSKIKSRATFIVGAGTNDTQLSVEYGLLAKRLGADGVLLVSPYYNKCTQNGLISHYNYIAKNIKLPYIAYNVPSRTGFNIQPQTVKELMLGDCFAGFKEANSNIDQVQELFNKVEPNYVYCGNDNLLDIFLFYGASGVISVSSNLIPKTIKQICSYAQASEYEKMLKLNNNLFELNKVLFLEPNPIVVKYALSKLGIIKNELRLPLTLISEQLIDKVDNVLKQVGII